MEIFFSWPSPGKCFSLYKYASSLVPSVLSKVLGYEFIKLIYLVKASWNLPPGFAGLLLFSEKSV